MSSVRVISFYLPQYHPIPENDEWWGKGFTEWIHMGRAKPLFKGHRQPIVPGELGYYDLRVPETRERQAELAREAGIEGFCYWHYWLGGGKRLLERPFEDVLEAGSPDFPFCLGWANHDWRGTAFGAGNRLLVEQTYPGMEDHEEHFRFLLRAFKDPRYITVDGKPLFYIYRPRDLPDCAKVIEYWRTRAVEEGLKGLFVVADQIHSGEKEAYNIDGVHISQHRDISITKRRELSAFWKLWNKVFRKLRFGVMLRPEALQVYDYAEAMSHVLNDQYGKDEFPTIVPNWDTTPRLAKKAVVYTDDTPERFRQHACEALQKVADHHADQRIVFLRAWNEWAEGNYLEPDDHYGDRKLRILREELERVG